jgi:hypothetical protein
MVNPSNLYAEKIFSEHPIALWTLDDDIRYLSLISESTRDISTDWTISNSFVATNYSKTSYPYYKLDTYVTRISKASVSTSGTIVLDSPEMLSVNSDGFSVGFYYFLDSPYITQIEIGYYDAGTATTTYATAIPVGELATWNFASAIFNNAVEDVTIKIRFTYIAPISADTVSLFINGLTAGKWSEDYNTISLGAEKTTLPENISISGLITEGVKSKKYNATDNSAYYIVNGGNSYARSSSFPLVYGSKNSTILYYNDTDSPDPSPSLIFPGYGFLNESQKHTARTFEAWLRIKAQTTEPKRIIGPLTGLDGLYVNGPYLTLKIDENFGSHYVGEWDRPMLIQIVMVENSARLLLNGETVISLLYSTNDISLEAYSDSGVNQDWVGVFAHEDIPRIEIDCVAIYAYEIDQTLALRRFVYGMGVNFPDTMISMHGGESIISDFSVSNYANNHAYGESQKSTFAQGKLDNATLTGQRLSCQQYAPPTIVLEPDSTFTVSDFFGAQTIDNYINMQPDTDAEWANTESHIFFPTINPIADKTKAIYIIATRSENNASKQILFKIYDQTTKNYLEAYTITSGTNNIVYSFKYNGVVTTLGTVSGNVSGTKFAAGIVIDDLISADSSNGSNLTAFFSNQKNLSMFVGGDESFTENTTFTGKIYKVGFSNSRNLIKIDTLFTSGRFSGSTSTLDLHTASYTMVVSTFGASIFFDVAVNAYWQDFVPLSSLAVFNEGQYSLDYLQVNIDYPKPITFSEFGYATENCEVRTYLTFQDVESGANLDILDFGSPVRVTDTNIIETSGTVSSYEVVDNSIVYVPTSADIDTLALVMHIEMNVASTILNPLQIRNLQVASQAISLDPDRPTAIGTKKGIPLYSYGTGKHPLLLDRESVDSHFNLSSNSGLMLAGTHTDSSGYYMDINKNLSDVFDVALIQATMKFPMAGFLETEVLLFEIEKSDDTSIKIYIDEINSNRARVFAKDQDNNPYPYLEYFINGVKTAYPAVSLDEWVTLGLRVTEHYSLEEMSGKIKICGPMLLNNFSYFQLKAGDESNVIIDISEWIDVLFETSTFNAWSEYDTESTWGAVYVTTESATEINGLDIRNVYETFTGTSKIIANATEMPVNASGFKYLLYTGSQNYTITQTPA